MPVQVSCEVSVFQYGNDRRDQILLHRKFPTSHTLPMSAKGLSISFNPVKVCSAEHAWHDSYLIYRLQSMRPTHILRHLWLGYGWLSVSRMRPRIPGHLAIVFFPANHRFSHTLEKTTAACPPCILSWSRHLESGASS